MHYPRELTFQKDYDEGVIRLQTAAICICLDQDSNLDEDVAPFFATVEGTAPKGHKRSGKIDPHAYLYIEPTGNLAFDVEDVLTALVNSIERGLLKPLVLRVDLRGTISLIDTWIETRDFYRWCEERGLTKGEVCEEYDNCEFSIFSHAYDNADDLRKFYEAPFCVGEYADWIEARPFGSDVPTGEYDKIIRENIYLKMGLPLERSVDERPMQSRERSTLLSIIAALCHVADYDYTKPAKTAGLIQQAADSLGLSIGETTIEGKLKAIPKVVESRRK